MKQRLRERHITELREANARYPHEESVAASKLKVVQLELREKVAERSRGEKRSGRNEDQELQVPA